MAILVGYWLLLAFVPAPDGNGAGVFTMEGSLVGYVDRLLLPGRLHLTVHDPEGILSTVPAVATALLGMFTGEFIKMQREGLTDKKKVGGLVIYSEPDEINGEVNISGRDFTIQPAIEIVLSDKPRDIERNICVERFNLSYFL